MIYYSHVLENLTKKRGETTAVEDAGDISAGVFKVLTGTGNVRAVKLAPEGKELEFTTEKDYTVIHMQPFNGYALVYIEFK